MSDTPELCLPYDGDPCGCALCCDAEATLWNGKEAICADCCSRDLETRLTAAEARVAELERIYDIQFADANRWMARALEGRDKLEAAEARIAELTAAQGGE